MVFKHLLTAAIALLLFTVLTGVIYPLAVTGIAQLMFPHQANGSLISRNGKVVGSELIGQQFSDAKYFWGRPSATATFPYNAGASAGTNYGPTNAALLDEAKCRIAELNSADSLNENPVPIDLVTSSASGLDPHISIAAALYQVPRVARMRRLSEERVREIVTRCTEGRTFGLLGEPRVNVVNMNLTLDESHPDQEVQR